MSKPQQKRSASPANTLGRSSFSSIRERDSDFTQTFTSTKVSSYAQLAGQPQAGEEHDEHRPLVVEDVAVVDESASPVASSPAAIAADALPAASAAAVDAMLLSSHTTHSAGNATPNRWPARWPVGRLGDHESTDDIDMSDVEDALDRSLNWLDYTVRVSGASESSVHVDNDMAMEDVADVTDANIADVHTQPITRQAIERLPVEIFRLIVNHLILDTPPNGIDRRNVDLMSLLVTSRPLYAMTLETLYRRVTIPHSRIFQKFLSQLELDNFRGTWVRRLDFSHFNPVSLFSTASEREAARNLTAETLLRCLNLTPDLHEFLIQDYIDTDISEDVLRKLLTGLPSLKALDLCGCSSASFRNAFTSLTAGPLPSGAWPARLGVQRLSLHKCINLPSSVFEFLLPKLDRLTHLDVSGTRITNAALHSIPKTARITHLNLAKCSLLTADAVIDFLTNHPAVNQNTLAFLSLGFDAATSQLLSEDDVSRLLPILPDSLKSLSLKGSKMSGLHLPELSQLSKHLEELAVGRGLSLKDVKSLVVPPADESNPSSSVAAEDWTPHSLRYIDLTDMSADEFDLTFLYIDSHILDLRTSPLEVIEVTEEIFKRVSKSKAGLARIGWRQSEIGARSWLVRGTPPNGIVSSIMSGNFSMENGQRPWKMGAQSWGMRKIPMAHAKVGGMYGSYMFGRKL